jgi:aspartate ammonia-lyase
MSNNQTQIALSLGNFSNKKLSDYPELIRILLQIKKSAALANFKAGEISEIQMKAIVAVCEKKYSKEDFLIDVHIGGGGIAVNQNINEWLSLQTGIEKEVINHSQSTSDVGHTAFRIALKKTFLSTKTDIQKISETYEKICNDWREVKITAHTCLRDAGETTLGHFFSGHQKLFNRRVQTLEKSIEQLEINIGGTVFGSSAGASANYQKFIFEELKKNCDFPLKLSSNLYDSAQNSDDLAEVSSQCGQVAKAILKISQDIRLLYSGPKAGLHAIELKSFMKGSSFFTQKSNPILPETLIQASLLMLGHDHAVQMALLQGELDLNVFDFFMGFLLLDQIEIFGKILPLWQQTLDSMELINAKS